MKSTKHFYLLTLLIMFVINNKRLCNGIKTKNPASSKYGDLYFDPKSTNGQDNELREGRDLIYEAMKMRTGVWPPQGKNFEKIVGGGLVEKQLLDSQVYSHARENPDIAIRFESCQAKL